MNKNIPFCLTLHPLRCVQVLPSNQSLQHGLGPPSIEQILNPWNRCGTAGLNFYWRAVCTNPPFSCCIIDPMAPSESESESQSGSDSSAPNTGDSTTAVSEDFIDAVEAQQDAEGAAAAAAEELA